MPKSPSACRTVGRTGRESVECWVTENEREDPRGSCTCESGKIGAGTLQKALVIKEVATMDIRGYKARQDKE